MDHSKVDINRERIDTDNMLVYAKQQEMDRIETLLARQRRNYMFLKKVQEKHVEKQQAQEDRIAMLSTTVTRLQHIVDKVEEDNCCDRIVRLESMNAFLVNRIIKLENNSKAINS